MDQIGFLHYRVTDQVFCGIMSAFLARRRSRVTAMTRLAESVGAKQVHTLAGTSQFAGFSFEPDAFAKLDIKCWRQVGGDRWAPKRKEGRAFWNLMRSIGDDEHPADSLKTYGLHSGIWAELGKEKYQVKVTGSEAKGEYFVSVPFRVYEEGIVAEYCKAKARGEQINQLVENAAWAAPVGWETVTIWQVVLDSDSNDI